MGIFLLICMDFFLLIFYIPIGINKGPGLRYSMPYGLLMLSNFPGTTFILHPTSKSLQFFVRFLGEVLSS